MYEQNEDVLEDIMRRSLVQHLIIRCGGNVGFVGPVAPRVPLLDLSQTLTVCIGEYTRRGNYIGRGNGGMINSGGCIT